jgi:hypothetical protein
VWVLVSGDRRNKQEVVTASGNCGGSLETGVSTRPPNCVGSSSGWEGQGKVDSSLADGPSPGGRGMT